jgi:molybdopterin/thiamine biosynthesis adenylyltransferase/rhodanese-related sulfurtransferase
MTIDRYTRQVILPEIGEEGQAKIAAASVLCIGAGGLGCPALLYLAAAGVGRIGIIDFDVVDESNLHRQVLFTSDQKGKNKAEAAKDRLLALNPTITVETHPFRLTENNAAELFTQYDIMIDGTDNFATKYLINDTAVKTGRPCVYGSILGFEGQLALFGAPDGPCYRCLFPHPPQNHVPTCAEAGIIGAVAGFVGSAQAMEAIKFIVGGKNFMSMAGNFWCVDLRTLGNRMYELKKNPDCIACSPARPGRRMQYASPACDFVPEVTAQQAQANKNAIFLDVREEHEWDAGHIENAHHFPLSALMEGDAPDLPFDAEILIYCYKGPRAIHAAGILKSLGYMNVSNITGGYAAWPLDKSA